MLLDNKSQGKVGAVISKKLSADRAELAILSSKFSIYGFAKLNKQLSKIQKLRLAIPESTNRETADLIGSTADRKFRNQLNITLVARACAAWLEKKADIRGVTTPISQNLFHIKSANQTTAISGSSPFTSSGLGFTPAMGHEMNTCFENGNECDSLLEWFDSI